MGLLLLIVLILLLMAACQPGYSRSWGYGPSGGLGLVLIIVVCSCSWVHSPRLLTEFDCVNRPVQHKNGVLKLFLDAQQEWSPGEELMPTFLKRVPPPPSRDFDVA